MEKLHDRFGKREVTVTLLGEEWFALLARAVGRGLSKEGAAAYNRAATKMKEQLSAASDAAKEGK